MVSKNFVGLFLLLIVSVNISAQSKKFDDVSISDFTGYPAKYDSSASAVVLYDIGYSYFNLSYACFFERKVRIKVLNDEGLEWGDVSLVFNKEYDQEIDRIKAFSYTLNGKKIERTELDKDQVFEETLYDKVRVKKFVIPGLSKGSILEYSYRKRVDSPFLMPDWKFHKSIPVMYSEYKMKIPNNFSYNTIVKGVDTLTTSSVESYLDNRAGGVSLTISKENLPAVKPLPFINSTDDFITEIYNQLVRAEFIGSPVRKFNNSWEKVADEMRDHPSIGKQRLNGDMKKKVDELVVGIEDPIEKARIIYNYVGGTIKWNGFYGLVTDEGIRDAFEKNSGNAVDINMMAMEMLRHAGLKADYALISTKKNGKIIVSYPIINQFNHIVVILQTDEKLYLLDATEGIRPLGLPPVKDLFRSVFVVKDKSHGWLSSAPEVKTSRVLFIDQKFEPNGKVLNKISGRLKGYFTEEMDSDEDVESIIDKDNGFELDSLFSEKKNDANNTMTFDLQGHIQNEGYLNREELIYYNPFKILKLTDNPFVEKERSFPVYFPFPYQDQIVMNIEIPEGYEIEELPKPSLIKIGNNLASSKFITQVLGGKITLILNISINQKQYEVKNYPAVQQLFDRFVSSKEQQIVFKKSEQ